MELCYPKEPIHPNDFGHELMAETFLQSLEKETGSDLLETGVSPHTDNAQWNKLIGLVQQQRLTYDRALLNEIGHGNPGVIKKETAPLPEEEKASTFIDIQIQELIMNR
jgi:hypothetical protein